MFQKGLVCTFHTLHPGWSRMKQLILLPENLNVSRGGAEGNIEIQGRSKQLLSVIIMLKP